ncbi:putative TonB-dependent receptor BfrD [Methylorubrum extorquens]
MRTARQSRTVLRPMLLGSVACTSIAAAVIHPARAQLTDINTGLPTAQAVHPLAAPPSVGGVTLDMISVAGSGAGRGLVVDSSGAQVGYLARRLRSSTKTDTPLIDTPQAISVVTEAQIRDQNVQSIGEALRYVPGVAIAQGEGHRDEILIRGQRTTADFFVNGIRDDARYFRDLYNTQRIEVLKGPNAMIFGRGGGVVNRVLKEADGVPIREVLVQGGQFWNKRMAVDLGDRVSDTTFFRLNGVFEDTGTYRDFIDIRRYGVNPTMTFLLGPQTTLRLSYEVFADNRIADRGIPSQFGRSWRYRENTSTLFGAPLISNGFVDAHIGNAQLDHVFESGVVMRSQTRIADYAKYHQNAYPNSPVSADETSFVMRGYGSQTDRTNYFNQTDFTYKFNTGPLAHTVVAGLELGFQEGIDFRRDFIWNSTGTRNLPVNPFAPTTTEGATLRNLASGRNNTYRLGVFSAFAQDQIEIDEHLQFIVGARFDRFDFESRDRRPDAVTGLPAQPNSRIDNLVSPRVGVVVKPLPNLAFYGSYSVSFLPSAGDQFRVLDPTTALSAPERFENA